ncbi:MAG TPA: hypothetical protein VEQ63_11675 [Bryobacteraceae bacterium]|nr:hypothetical protein [Bryobacteraceae bacterium]
MRYILVLTSSFAIASCLFGATADQVLSRMDAGAAKFQGLSADVSRITYTKVIDDKSSESGKILLKKQGPKDLQVLIDLVKPDAKTISFRGRRAEIFLPNIKTVQEYDLGKQGGLVDQFLLVGFGTTGRELKSNYSVKYAGQETIAGQSAHKLELTPIGEQLKERLRKLELWITETGEYPVQQMFTLPSGDYYLFTYSGVKVNPPLNDETLRLKLPKGVKREKMQK